MKVLFLTSKSATEQELVREVLGSYSAVVTHFGDFSVEFLRQNSITAILSDRNGFIIPKEIIDEVEGRVYNTHPSLLPLHRGWQPIFFSVLEETKVGVSIHQVNSGLDKGLLVAQSEIKVESEDTLKSLHFKCRAKILELLQENWSAMAKGTCELQDQVGVGCYHSKLDFDNLFSRLHFGWDSPLASVRGLGT